MKKILLTGHGGFFNRGCEAIVRGTVEIIRRYIPDSHITLCSYSVQEDIARAEKKKIDVDSIIPPNEKGAQRPSLSWMRQTFDRRILSRNMSYKDYIQLPLYRKSDVVMSIGGDNFTDDYGVPDHFFNSMICARKAGAKTVIWGASIGPFKDSDKAKRWAGILNKVDLITIREQASVEYLRSLGITRNVQMVADPAFILPPVRPESCPVERGRSSMLVGIGMSSLVFRYGISSEQLVKAFGDFIRYLQKSFNARVILVPHVTGHQPHANDLTACEEALKMLPEGSPVFIADQEYDAREMKYCISQCDYFIGARTHSTIASFSTEVPTITIAYSQKAWGINEQLLGTDEFIVPVGEVSLERLTAVFEKLRKNKDEIKDRLQQKLPFIRALAIKNGEYLAGLLS